jgi:hypothetical protein
MDEGALQIDNSSGDQHISIAATTALFLDSYHDIC